MSGNRSKIIAFNYFGGKLNMVDQLIKYFPKHIHFVDVFCGSMAVTLNKKPSKIDTANDINGEVVNFFRVLRERKDELIEILFLTPVSREEYNQAFYQESKDPLERARNFYVRCRQSFYGLGAQRLNKGWHLAKISSYTKYYPETVSKWINGVDKLDEISHRLLTIQLENKSWDDLIPALDSKNTFFYLDPPYPHLCRSGKNDYKFEFSDEDHLALNEMLSSIDGMAMISSYDNPMYNELYKDWTKVRFPFKKNKMQSKKVVQECIWMNYKLEMELDLFSSVIQKKQTETDLLSSN